MLIAPYPTKKHLKASIGQPLNYRETSLFGPEYKHEGNFVVAGPTEFHKWYAKVHMKDGKILKVEDIENENEMLIEACETCKLPSRLKTINSHVGLSRWFGGNEGSVTEAGHISRHHLGHIPTPYSYSPTNPVYNWNGKHVVVKETKHKHYEIHEVPYKASIHDNDMTAENEFSKQGQAGIGIPQHEQIEMRPISEETEKEIEKLIQNALADDVVNITDVFTSLLGDKLVDAIEIKKVEVADIFFEDHLKENQLDELRKSTLGSYIRNAASHTERLHWTAGYREGSKHFNKVKDLYKKADKRWKGIQRATTKLEK